MPRSTPDPLDEAGEVLDVYTGDTLEEAMAEAVAALGAGLEVRRARKVRAGVRGLMGKQVYEVLAVAGPPLAPAPSSGDPLQDAVARLLEQAEADESGRPVQDVAPARAESRLDERLLREALQEHEQSFADALGSAEQRHAAPAPRVPSADAGAAGAGAGVAVDLRAAGQARAGGPPLDAAPVPSAAAPPAYAVAEPVVEAPLVARVERRAPARPRRLVEAPSDRTVEGSTVVTRRRPLPSPHPDLGVCDHQVPARPVTARRAAPRSTGWSRTGLARLGLPGRVLAALPPDDPADDLAWLVAVTAAIASCVPAPAPAGPEHPVVIDGHGLAGALAILEAGCRGATPGTISSGGRVVDATAMELALVLHASLTGAAS